MRQDHLSPDASEADLAAFWFARMNGGHAPSPQDEAAFHRWLDEGAANMQAYRDCLEAWRMLDMDAGEPEVLALRAAALRRDDRRTTRRRALFGLTGGAVAGPDLDPGGAEADRPPAGRVGSDPGAFVTSAARLYP